MIILVIGISVRHIACSAAKAGHLVIAADCYCDLDLKRCASKTVLLSQKNLAQLAGKYAKMFHPDAVVLGPGLEEAHVKGVRVLNNLPEKIAQVSDKLWLARWLESRGYPAIPTRASVEELTEDWAFPIIVKPRKGAGGVGCMLVRNESNLLLEDHLIIQKFVKGLPASVSVIGNGREARAVAVNEQLIGADWTGANGFRYSGNITPLEHPSQGIAEMAEDIISELGLVGSNGVDFLLTKDGPVVAEVNPRFQGSLDAVELSTGMNVFQAHLNAFDGCLPERSTYRRTAGRAIIYADDDLKIEEGLSASVEWITDIPRPGSIIKRDDPVASILAVGGSREIVLRQLMNRATMLRVRLRAFSQANSLL